ncbi:MAG: hypothetical protein F4W68_06485 [Cenarchaeum sp. SB0661_bin_35]|nr:hypothetical protein [Cenarchaeum sp. SB0661_bin_35]
MYHITKNIMARIHASGKVIVVGAKSMREIKQTPYTVQQVLLPDRRINFFVV